MAKAPSVEPVVRSRLLPRISFRLMMMLTTVAAVLAAIARVAGNGDELAKSFMMSLGFFASCFLAFAVLFLFSWSVAVLRRQCGFVATGVGAMLGVITIAGVQLPHVTNWYLPSFLIVAGSILLFVPLRESDDLVGNPFAEGQLPPQILPPREQRT